MGILVVALHSIAWVDIQLHVRTEHILILFGELLDHLLSPDIKALTHLCSRARHPAVCKGVGILHPMPSST